MMSVAPLLCRVPSRFSRPDVLLVDDHEPSLRQLQEVVELEGHR